MAQVSSVGQAFGATMGAVYAGASAVTEVAEAANSGARMLNTTAQTYEKRVEDWAQDQEDIREDAKQRRKVRKGELQLETALRLRDLEKKAEQEGVEIKL